MFAKKPLSFGIAEGSSAMVRVSLAMSFPELEVAKGGLQATAVFDATGGAVPAKGAAEVDRAAQTVFTTLLLGGGRASAAVASTVVKCAVVNAAKPQPVPATGGL
jgi:hypothetical protein